MYSRAHSSIRLVIALSILAFSAGGAYAQAAGAADPFSLWDHAGNPAAWAFSPDAIAFGFQGDVALADPASSLSAGSLRSYALAYGVPGLLYTYGSGGAGPSHALTSAIGVGSSAGLGVRFRWDGTSEAARTRGYQDVGLILRPARFASVSIGLDDALDLAGDGFSGARLGLALRPLAFDARLGSALSIGADALVTGAGASVESVSARFILDPWLSVAGRYSFADASIGLGVSVALSGLETSLGYGVPVAGAAPAGSGAPAGSVSVGQSLRLGRATRSASRVFGAATLVIDEPGLMAGTLPRLDLDPGYGDKVALWFDLAAEAVRRAASDPSIGALVMLEPPLFDSEARAQEFGRAVAEFKKAGKPVLVHARSMNRLSYVYAAAGADLVALDPNGMLPVVDVAGFSLYLKGLLGKLGIEAYNLRSHDTKTAFNMLSESGMTEAERAMVERYVGGLAGQSYAALEAARGPELRGGAAAAIGAGPYMDPSEAVAAGLIDALMYRDEFDEAVEEKTGKAATVDIRSYARERGLAWGLPIAKKVAVVHLSGSIIEGEGVAGRSIGDSAAELLAALREDRTVSGVLLRVDSGGGSVLTSDRIAREVKRLKEDGKPVVVSMAGFAASGGYYISAYADKIIAEAGTITGSIGVTSLAFNAVGLLEKLGVGTGSVSAGPSGEFGNPFLPRRAADEAAMMAGVEYAYGRFIDVVAAGRGLDKARVDELGRGRIWLGSEAVENGLADGLGGLSEAKAAIAELVGGSARFVDYLPGEADLRSLASMLGGALGSALGSRGAGSTPGSVSVSSPGSVAATIGAAARFAEEAAAMGDGLLYLAPEYLYRAGRP